MTDVAARLRRVEDRFGIPDLVVTSAIVSHVAVTLAPCTTRTGMRSSSTATGGMPGTRARDQVGKAWDGAPQDTARAAWAAAVRAAHSRSGPAAVTAASA